MVVMNVFGFKKIGTQNKYCATIAAIVFLFVFYGVPVFSEPLLQKQEREMTIKASFLLKLTKFIYWPKKRLLLNKRESLVLCFPGADPFEGILEKARKEALLQMNLEIKKYVPIKEMSGCSILFLTAKENRFLDQILSTIEGYPVVTVTDIDGFAERGALINFVVVDNKIRFRINRQSMESSPIKLSSELLDLSIMVDQP